MDSKVMDWKPMNWGPSFWRCIHYMAIHGKREVIDKIPGFIPCETCRGEWVGVGADEDLVDWSIREHNRVNGKLGKWDKWDLIDFNISQKPTCDICEGREHVCGFPWTFLYTLASSGAGEGEEFIKEFVAEYPCAVCRGRLVEGIPGPDETHMDWVHRNHIRFNQERGLRLPEPAALRGVGVAGSGSATAVCENC